MPAMLGLMVWAVLTGSALAATVRPVPPPTEASQIWLDPALPGTAEAAELAAQGYVREEYFLSGEANVYGYGSDGAVGVERSGVPYATRVIVLRPRDPKRFSGTVQFQPFHPMNGVSFWATIKEYALANGDAYVGVMTGADDNTRRAPPGDHPVMATKALTWFNPERYAPIRWPEDEDGIRWDVIADTVRKVREPGALLGPLKATHVYASGWSYTGSVLRTWINLGFHDMTRRPDGRPLIDGYLLGISSFSFRSGFVPINSHTPNLAEDDPRRANKPIDAPLIELQSENEAISNREPQTPDRDRPPGAHRLYEVPGLTHGSGRRGSPVLGLQLARRNGRPPAQPADSCPYPTTDIDMAAFAQAAHENLDRWVRTGAPPPRAARLQQDPVGVARRDASGNAVGGLRVAQIEVPLASHGAAPESAGCDRGPAGLGSPTIPMRRVPLPAERLKALYPGGKAEYLRKFDAHADRLVAERWLRAPDAAQQKAEARAAADKAFP